MMEIRVSHFCMAVQRRAVAGALLVAACFGLTVAAGARPLGTVSVISGPTACQGQRCYVLEVVCPDVQQAQRVDLKVGNFSGTFRGTILFMTGGGGTSLWETFGVDAQRVLGELRAAGFRTVQLAWQQGWLLGAAGALEGQAALACRPATVAAWAYQNLHMGGATRAFCATGNSGGAGQTSYMLTDYGLASLLDAAVPSGGPPFGRIDLGCLQEGPDPTIWYDPGAAATIDRGYGFLVPGSGPCALHDTAFRALFEQNSLALPPGRQWVYPTTFVWFMFGALDTTSAVAQGVAYHDKLVAEGQVLLDLSVIPGTPHGVPSTAAGANAIRDALLAECIVR
jgi:hypothetical protein